MNPREADHWSIANRGNDVVKDFHFDARLGRPTCPEFGQHDDHHDQGCGQRQYAGEPVGARRISEDKNKRTQSHSPMIAQRIEVVLMIPILLP